MPKHILRIAVAFLSAGLPFIHGTREQQIGCTNVTSYQVRVLCDDKGQAGVKTNYYCRMRSGHQFAIGAAQRPSPLRESPLSETMNHLVDTMRLVGASTRRSAARAWMRVWFASSTSPVSACCSYSDGDSGITDSGCMQKEHRP